MRGTVASVSVGEVRGEPKRQVDRAAFVEGEGIEGDAHAGAWHRQVSILDAADVERTRALVPGIVPGAFAENLVLEGMDLGLLGLGTLLEATSGVRLRVTQIGKDCHDPCRIGRTTGACILPARGLFARVERGGEIARGDEMRVIELVERSRIQAVVVTVSDRRSAGVAADTAGPAAADVLRARLGAHVYRIEVVPDERGDIEDRLRHYCDGHSIDLVVTVGGTGFSPRDVTPEATRAVVERPTPGLDEAMRAASAARTPHACLSRGASGIRGSTLVLNLPGSTKAAVENLEAVLPALPHGLEKLRGSRADCA